MKIIGHKPSEISISTEEIDYKKEKDKEKGKDIENLISNNNNNYNTKKFDLNKGLPSINAIIQNGTILMNKNITFQIILFLFVFWIVITIFEFISALILGNSDIISDGFFNTFKTIGFLISCLSILFNYMYSNVHSFLVLRIELTAALTNIIFEVIVSVYMLLQALHLVTDDEERIPPINYLTWLYVIKTIFDMLALLRFSDFIIHPSIQVKLQLWKFTKTWKKLNELSIDELKKVTKFRKIWNNHFENMNALCVCLISDLFCSLSFVIFFYIFGTRFYGRGYLFISIMNFFIVIFLVRPLFSSVLKIFMQGKSEMYECFYRKINQELTYCNGSLGVKHFKFWMIAQNYLKGQIKIYSNNNIDRLKLKDAIHKIADDVGVHADISIEFDE